MKRSEWQAARLATIARQHGRCAVCVRDAKDVVRTGEHVLTAFCRSCRLRRDAPARCLKARRTIEAKRLKRTGQQELFA